MGKSLAEKRPLKPHKSPDKARARKRLKKSKQGSVDDIVVDRSPCPAESGDASDEAAGEVRVCKGPSEYDSLLRKLGSGSEALADLYKRRKREEEGKSDSEEEENDDSESHDVSGEESDVEEGVDDEANSNDDMESGSQVLGEADIEELNEAVESEKEGESSDSDQEGDLKDGYRASGNAPRSMSSFHAHLEHNLSTVDVDDLTNRKWKFQWEFPVFESSTSKWKGTGGSFLNKFDDDSCYGLKPKLYKHWLDMYKKSGGNEFHSSRQKHFFALCSKYYDILHSNKRPFYLKGHEEDLSIMDAYIMHSLNHVFRTRDLVKRNEAKLAKLNENNIVVPNDDGFLDRGFTRPKVLILLPLASIALRVVNRLIQLTPPSYKTNVEHIDRFYKDFGGGDAEDSDTNDDIPKPQRPSKPSDFQALFGGNNEDHFMMGIKFTRRSIKLYSDFYSSDVIVASPIGVMTKIGAAKYEKDKDVDFLSSIEVLVVDHADLISMQSWSHVNTVVEQLNKIPSKSHGTDVMRIRQWYLDGHARFYRQTILLGYVLTPDINALFNRHCLNYQGKVKSVTEFKGVLPKVLLQVRQIYERFDASSIIDADDARFDYFVQKVFPKIKDSLQGGTMLFISSYFEFVRVRNFLKSQEASFCLLGEYTKQSDISRARIWFFEGTRKMMLYTERVHFFRRYKIRGVKNLIIYSLPERKEFYPEIVNMLEDSDNMTCTALFSRFDQLRLEKIVGTKPSKRMISSDKSVFVFC
ncbi:hypothetical protein Scep_021056 [Stephania cephalantha]|uniref:U3 small nucleolar RNA-associated protein 25 n=1 Tax=Stephania cephalantha TaxID=152367 RepID=A0AAP0F5E6_9MAGN